jgi:hypothetical protein
LNVYNESHNAREPLTVFTCVLAEHSVDSQLLCENEQDRARETLHKFMVALDEKVFVELDRRARTRNISIQELLRAVVVPEWIRREEQPGLDR